MELARNRDISPLEKRIEETAVTNDEAVVSQVRTGIPNAIQARGPDEEVQPANLGRLVELPMVLKLRTTNNHLDRFAKPRRLRQCCSLLVGVIVRRRRDLWWARGGRAVDAHHCRKDCEPTHCGENVCGRISSGGTGGSWGLSERQSANRAIAN